MDDWKTEMAQRMAADAEGYVVGVCGGRDLNNRRLVWGTLDGIHKVRPITLLISGGCPDRFDEDGNVTARSADSLAEEWARKNEVDTLIRYAKWKKHGRPAGPIRNSDMALDAAHDWVVFPGGTGTADMARKAAAAGSRIIEALQPRERSEPPQ